MAHDKFTMETLAQAMAPSKIVLDSFVGQNSLNSQHEFGITIQNLWNMFGPSKRYLRGLLQKYIRMVEAEGHTIEDDVLIAIIIHCNQIRDIYPDPSESCYLNFHVTTNRHNDNDSLRLRIFPQHNDISLRLWEAGAVLAEYFLKYPKHISGKAILEIGAGVGLTGLVAASYCGARKVVMTDYSSDCLLNLHHNIHINGVQDSTHISQVG
jgi:Lysine methyltransferase